MNFLYKKYVVISIVFTIFSCKETKKDYFENGNIKAECEIQDGIENGLCITYYESGEIKSEIFSQNGKKQGRGVWYYKNGNIMIEGHFNNNLEDGKFNEYYESGDLKKEVFFMNGLQNGLYKEFYIDGKVKEELNFEKGLLNGYSKIFYNNGFLKKEEIYKNDTISYYVDYDSLGNWIDEYRKVEVYHPSIILVSDSFNMVFELLGPKISIKDSVLCSFKLYSLLENDIEILEDKMKVVYDNKVSFGFFAKKEGMYGYSGVFVTNRKSEKMKNHPILSGEILFQSNKVLLLK